jgi:hypothetical protein
MAGRARRRTVGDHPPAIGVAPGAICALDEVRGFQRERFANIVRRGPEVWPDSDEPGLDGQVPTWA